MKLDIACDKLLKALQQTSNCVEHRQALPILSTVLFRLDGEELSLTATNTEVEITSFLEINTASDFQSFAVPARKLLDICRNLPGEATLSFKQEQNKIILNSGKGNYTFLSLAATDFPYMDEEITDVEFSIDPEKLKYLFSKTQFAIAQQDVRFYFNGVLLDLAGGTLAAVGADGHRMAFASVSLSEEVVELKKQAILPRNAVIELSKLLNTQEKPILIKISSGHVCLQGSDFLFKSKLIDSVFPDYRMLLKTLSPNSFTVDKEIFKQALQRSLFFTNDQFHAVRICLNPGVMQIAAKNTLQEESNEEIEIKYDGNPISFGFNVKYLLEGIAIIQEDHVKIAFSDADKGVFIGSITPENNIYCVMPVRL